MSNNNWRWIIMRMRIEKTCIVMKEVRTKILCLNNCCVGGRENGRNMTDWTRKSIESSWNLLKRRRNILNNLEVTLNNKTTNTEPSPSTNDIKFL